MLAMVSDTQQWVNFGIFVAGGAAVATLIIGDAIKRRWLRNVCIRGVLLCGMVDSPAY